MASRKQHAEMSIADRVRHLIADHLGQEFRDVTPGSSLMLDLGADHLDLVEIALSLDDEFKLTFDADEVEQVFDPLDGERVPAHSGYVRGVIDLVERTRQKAA